MEEESNQEKLNRVGKNVKKKREENTVFSLPFLSVVLFLRLHLD
jgi:hypothetical protein